MSHYGSGIRSLIMHWCFPFENADDKNQTCNELVRQLGWNSFIEYNINDKILLFLPEIYQIKFVASIMATLDQNNSHYNQNSLARNITGPMIKAEVIYLYNNMTRRNIKTKTNKQPNGKYSCIMIWNYAQVYLVCFSFCWAMEQLLRRLQMMDIVSQAFWMRQFRSC